MVRTKKLKVPIDALIIIRDLRCTIDDNQYHPHWIRPSLLAARTFRLVDVYRTPLAPPGSARVPVHVKPSARSTWSPHALYLGPCH
jgi:hypothetical protein